MLSNNLARNPKNKVCRNCCRIGRNCGKDKKNNVLHFLDDECPYSLSNIKCPYKYCIGNHNENHLSIDYDETCAPLTEENIDAELVNTDTLKDIPLPEVLLKIIISYLGCENYCNHIECEYNYPLLGIDYNCENNIKYYCCRVCYTNNNDLIYISYIDKLEKLEKSRETMKEVEGTYRYKYKN